MRSAFPSNETVKQVREQYPAALGIRYLDTQMRYEQSKEKTQYCLELFKEMYETDAGQTDPSKLVYPYDSQKAEERLELSYYKASAARNAECARAIDETIHLSQYKEGHYNHSLAVVKLIREFGFARVNAVLAHNVRQSQEDAFSDSSRSWAGKFNITGFTDALLNTHPAVLENFIKTTRIIYDMVNADRFILPGNAESGKSVQGYKIIRSIAFNDKRGFAIGYNRSAADPFVCWQMTEENGIREYYWGTYGDKAAAEANYIARVMVHMDGGNIHEVQRQPSVAAEEKPSVLKQIRDAEKAPKPPRKPKSQNKRKDGTQL